MKFYFLKMNLIRVRNVKDPDYSANLSKAVNAVKEGKKPTEAADLFRISSITLDSEVIFKYNNQED
jgi:hypothetical protein